MLLCVIAGLLALSVIVSFYALRLPQAAPSIGGVLIQQPQTMQDFTLIDHHQRAFTKQDLQGKWHFVVYGYTFCPDICPITLSIMSSLIKDLEQDQNAEDTRVLFYSVDPARDTPERLATYVPHFHRDFIGLTFDQDTPAHRPFEKGLGVIYEIPVADAQGELYDKHNYPVNHGVMIYLLNPQGNLQAVFTPDFTDEGMFHFSTDQLYADYLAIRNYLE